MVINFSAEIIVVIFRAEVTYTTCTTTRRHILEGLTSKLHTLALEVPVATKSTEKLLGDQPRQTEVDSSGLDAVPISIITPC
jgi:hypothetical protein